jgi:hypothetical protein
MSAIQLRKALEDAIEMSHFIKGFRSLNLIAEDVYDSNPDLMEQMKRPVLISRIKRMIKAARLNDWSKSSQSNDQLTLPGFDNLPRRIFLPNGQRKLLDKATAKDVQKHISMLRKRSLEHPKILQMERVLRLMEKHNADKPRITWAKVKSIEFKVP